jgi:hypothetical protein
VLAVYLTEAVGEKDKRLRTGAPRSTVRTRCCGLRRMVAWVMDKKEINDPKMTLNFLIWVGGVFMLLLFAFLAHFVWRIF